MAKNKRNLQRDELNEIQFGILVVLGVLFFVATGGVSPLFHFILWLNLLWLFALLGYFEVGHVLWKLT